MLSVHIDININIYVQSQLDFFLIFIQFKVIQLTRLFQGTRH